MFLLFTTGTVNPLCVCVLCTLFSTSSPEFRNLVELKHNETIGWKYKHSPLHKTEIQVYNYISIMLILASVLNDMR